MIPKPYDWKSVLMNTHPIALIETAHKVGTGSLSVYTDESLRSLGTVGCRASAAVFFKDIDSGLGIGVSGLMLSTLAEIQAIVLALECVSLSSSVCLFLDSQSALDAYKDHSDIPENEYADSLADTFISDWFFSSHLSKHFLVADGGIISGNSRHFVHDVYHFVCHVHWKVGFGSKFLSHGLLYEIDWHYSSLVWHPDLHMATSYTSKALANVHTYFMKALHCWLPVTVHKCLYDKHYSSILCLYCGKIASYKVVEFVCSLSLAFRDEIWLVHAKHQAYIEKNDLILFDGSALILVFGLTLEFFAGVVKMLGIAEAFGVCFGFCKSYLFFSGIGDSVSVHIAV
ncbi:hypothetical protein G9A89_004732 [Geosiphon pyriformis]|nr:hypothetical protein G9A89_004732 [Geosiphon pyriformis]